MKKPEVLMALAHLGVSRLILYIIKCVLTCIYVTQFRFPSILCLNSMAWWWWYRISLCKAHTSDFNGSNWVASGCSLAPPQADPSLVHCFSLRHLIAIIWSCFYAFYHLTLQLMDKTKPNQTKPNQTDAITTPPSVSPPFVGFSDLQL